MYVCVCVCVSVYVCATKQTRCFWQSTLERVLDLMGTVIQFYYSEEFLDSALRHKIVSQRYLPFQNILSTLTEYSEGVKNALALKSEKTHKASS